MKKIAAILGFLLCAHIGFAQTTQIVKGKVLDEASKQALIGVSVELIHPELKGVGAVTDEQGYFRIENVPLGRQSFKVSYVGYEDKIFADIIVTAGKEIFLNVSLQEQITDIEAVTVTYDRTKDGKVTNNEYATLSARSFNTEDTKRYAGALGDPSRMAANFAGVISGNDSRNDLVVRGNSPAGMLWQLEGLNIPNPNHFGALGTTGGPVSILNNNVLAKSDFMTSAFPAQYGNANAGVFDLRMREGNKDKHEFVGQVGFNGFEVGAEGPFSKKYGGSFLLNYRYSTLSFFKTLGINFGTGNATPNYQDLSLKIDLPVSKKGKISIFSIAGKSDVSFLGNEEDTTKTNFYGNENSNTIVNYATGILGTSYEHQLSAKTNAKITFGLMGTQEEFLGDSISISTREAFRSGEAKFTTEKYATNLMINHKFNAKNSLQIGANLDYLQFNLFNKEIYGGGVAESVQVNINDATTLLQGYAQWKHRFNALLTLNAGLHWQNYSLNTQNVIEPRVALKYLIGSKQSISMGLWSA
ncbi:MAG: carboxypeptidase-like regulatory domain-containing protein [Thermonemataceae bacterium]|nr:carboxypeptidase-like regulatory domain-containing protein [Thermonemataceae bacterium]